MLETLHECLELEKMIDMIFLTIFEQPSIQQHSSKTMSNETHG